MRRGDFLLSDKKQFVQAIKRLSSIDPLAPSDNLLIEQPELVSPLRYYRYEPIRTLLSITSTSFQTNENSYFSTNHLTSQLETVMDRQELEPLLQRQLDMENSLKVSVPSITANQVSYEALC